MTKVDPHFYKNFLLAAIAKGFNNKDVLIHDPNEEKGNLFYTNHHKIAYGQLEMKKLIEEKDGKVVLTKLGKKYSKKGFGAYLDKLERQKRRKAWFKKHRDIWVGLGVGIILLLLGTITTVILHYYGYV
ncbi:hypothetical protein NE848_12820 [Gramella jeungdoensis]|uniref:Uncharacterized protein n=1 Tax=Gramella jeungdoensis TaxID=708091 RepID=A0ABT0Z656_9FLAO|nr:hypothetical protein [Gramella jeungdoensis]MCM8570269.1 hypothetical protein [Gramella jeungdoensis]